jgi:hypothetical protein
MQSVTVALNRYLAQVIWRGVFQAWEDGQRKAYHSTIVQSDHHTLTPTVKSRIDREQLMLHPLSCPPRNRFEFLVSWNLELSHEPLSISHRLQVVFLQLPLRSRQFQPPETHSALPDLPGHTDNSTQTSPMLPLAVSHERAAEDDRWSKSPRGCFGWSEQLARSNMPKTQTDV